MKKPVYLWQALLNLSKMLIYKLHYDHMQQKYGSKLKLCYMDIYSFAYEIARERFYEDIVKDVETRFDTSEYLKGDNRPLLFLSFA